MWPKKNKEKEEKTVVKTTKTSYVSQTSQTFSVRTTEQRIRSESVGNSNSFFLRPTSSSPDTRHLMGSLSKLDTSKMLSPPPSTAYKTPSASNLSSKVSTDARPIPTTVNLNYQSPYRNSPAYRSFQQRPTATTTATPYRAPPIPTTIQPLPPSASKPSTKIVVKKSKKFYDASSVIPTYPTHSKRRGEVLIINNIMFKDKGERLGAKVDHENLEILFKQMGFKVTIEKDLRTYGMVSKVKNFSKKSSLASADIAITIVMSHGTKNLTLGGTEVFGLDEEAVPVEELIKVFNEKDCKYMANKPKIFIFQCCRGDNEQFVQRDAVGVSPKEPALTNALIAYSTLPGFVSHRDPVHGTWYIRTLCDVFSQHAHEYHVEDLLKMVDVQLSSIPGDIKQTTHYENRGFKRCYLHPV